MKEYVQATPIDLATENSTKYYYKVRLSLSDSYLKVHFIANGPQTLPFKYEDEVMSVQTASGNQDAYWQKIELPKGITAKQDDEGVYIKVNGEYVVSDETKAKFQDIPLVRNFAKIVVESETDEALLMSLGEQISDRVLTLDGENRRILHLAAVFACNFTNHMYDLASRLLADHGIPFSVLLPLIDETAAKVHDMAPRDAQTGPAVRYDENVMRRQLAMLSDAQTAEIYKLLSQSIHDKLRPEEN